MKFQPLHFPLTPETAKAVNQFLASAWNSNNPGNLLELFSPQSKWHCGEQSLTGREDIKTFVVQKWALQLHYRQAAELWACSDRRISNRIAYEWQSAEDGQWFRACGIENLEFGEDGLIMSRLEYVSCLKILEAHRRFK
jgi:uncharacterized protein